MAIKYWTITVSDLPRMIDDHDQSIEAMAFASRVVPHIRADETSLEILPTDTFDVKADFVSRNCL